jgi:AbrB family looped-hinge helix DNA binding protein
MPVATLTSKGQITIPREIRDRLRLRTGDRVCFTEQPDGTVIFRPQNGSLLDLVGTLKTVPRRRASVSVEEMGEAVRRRWSRDGA